MKLSKRLDGLTGNVSSDIVFFNKPVSRPWVLSKNNDHKDLYCKVYYSMPYGKRSFRSGECLYTFDLEPIDEIFVPYVRYRICVLPIDEVISDVFLDFDGPDDLALLWKLSL